MATHRLGWKGILFSSGALLYADAEAPRILMVPILLFLYIPKLVLSYLKVSDEGIELHYWPNYRFNVQWDEIERLGKAIVIGERTIDILYVRTGDREGTAAAVDRRRGIREKRIIPLSDFRGWPAGALYNELVRFIPEIMQRVEGG